MSDAVARRAASLVMRWTSLLVRGLPRPVAEDRIAEIASDLWEQRDADAHSDPRLAAAIVVRALRGLPADLVWRRTIRRNAAPKTATAGWSLSRGTIAKKKHQRPVKPWIPLTGMDKPFDQTNGAVDFDTPDKYDARNVEADILAKGVASNTVNVGFFGGGGI